MEVRIGVQQAARELVIDTPDTPDVVAGKVAASLAKHGVFELVDEKGHRIVVPADRLAYIEIASPETRRVGFGTI